MLFNDWSTVNAIYNFGGMHEKDKDKQVTRVIIKVYLSQSIQEPIKLNFLKAVFHKFYLARSWIFLPFMTLSNIWIYPIPIKCFAKKLCYRYFAGS